MDTMQKILAKVKTQLQPVHQEQLPSGHVPHLPSRRIGGPGFGMKWPPQLAACEVLGEVVDINGRNIPRDIGRSVQLGGEYYYVFGDTFCFDDKPEFVGLVNNTIAHIPDKSKPTHSSYLTRNPRVPEFIPFTESESIYNNDPRNKKANKRYVNWSFGGIIEDSPGYGHGWIFYDSIVVLGEFPGKGMGVCRVSKYDGHNIRAERHGGMVFGPDEPRFGSISNIIGTDGYVYLLGSKDLVNHMARIKHGADMSMHSNYEYFTEQGWRTTYRSQLDLEPVLGDQAQGAIMYLPDHGPAGKPYVWVGVNKWMDSKMWCAAASKPEGPYDIQFLMETPKVMGSKSQHRYCIYPHPWAYDLARGELLVSWSDDGQMGGKVAAAKLRFEMVEPPKQEQDQEQYRQAPLSLNAKHLE